MAVNESRLDTLKKSIEKREKIVRDETEKLKKAKEDYARAKSTMLAEYMEKENIEFNDDFKKHIELAKRIIASGISDEEIAEFFSLSDSGDTEVSKENTDISKENTDAFTTTNSEV